MHVLFELGVILKKKILEQLAGGMVAGGGWWVRGNTMIFYVLRLKPRPPDVYLVCYHPTPCGVNETMCPIPIIQAALR